MSRHMYNIKETQNKYLSMLRAKEIQERPAGDKTRETARDDNGPVCQAKESQHHDKSQED